ncbi:MAG: TPM domain-containing protein, partial [Abiotrophia defectiva]|nr:TPM domain-containing protein [Abiotrophia defectiva]
MKTKKWRGFLLLLGFVFLFMVGCGAKTSNLPDKPERSVVDEAKVLSQDTLAYIDQVNRQLSQTSEQYQIGVYLPADLKGFSIEELANKVAKKWQVGFSGTNNGILLVVAPNDRKMR